MKRSFFVVLTAILAGLFIFAFAEVTSRLIGLQSWSHEQTVHPNEPALHEPDPELGWRNKPGHYSYPGYRSKKPIIVTFLKNHSRRTGVGNRSGRKRIALIGGSLTQGFAVSDSETFAWKLQKKMPRYQIENYGCGGYGTYQSLLQLRRLLRGDNPPAVAVYGFYTHHLIRNVADHSWLKSLAQFSSRGHINLPYVDVEKGALREYPPTAYPRWSFDGSSAFIQGMKDLLYTARSRDRALRSVEIAERLFREMNLLCKKKGVRFLFVILQADPLAVKNADIILDRNQITHANCWDPATEHLRVAGEGHPSGERHTFWADCMARFLRGKLSAAGSSSAFP